MTLHLTFNPFGWKNERLLLEMKQDKDGQSRKAMEYKANCMHSINSRLEWRIINYNCKDAQSTNYKLQVQENLTICPIFRVLKKPSPCSLPTINYGINFSGCQQYCCPLYITFSKKKKGGKRQVRCKVIICMLV